MRKHHHFWRGAGLFAFTSALAPAAWCCTAFDVRFQSPQSQFAAYVGQNVSVSVQVYKCGTTTPVDFSVNVTFTSSYPDDSFQLQSQGRGVFTGSWTPKQGAGAGVTVYAVASAGASLDFSPGLSGSLELPPPAVSLDRQNLSFSVIAGGPATTQNVTVTNSDPVPHTISINTTGGAWLTSSAGGTVQPESSLTAQVKVDSSALAAGSYSGSLNVNSDAQPIATALVAVAAAAPATPLQLSADQYLLAFQANPGDPPVKQTITIFNGNGTAADVAVQTNGIWLSVSPSQFRLAANASQPVVVTANPAGLAAGSYGGGVNVQPAGGQLLQITGSLTVQPLPHVVLSLNPLTFQGSPGGPVLHQTVYLQNPGTTPVSFATIAPLNMLFTVTPASGTVPPAISSQPGTVALNISADPGKLAAGNYTSSIAIVFPSGSGPLLSLSLTVSTAPPVCTPASLLVQPSEPSQSVVVGQPYSLRVTVADNCGNFLSGASGSVQAAFSNGDPSLKLTSLGNGIWVGTWTPAAATGTSVRVQFAAFTANGATVLSGAASTLVTVVSSCTVLAPPTNSVGDATGTPAGPVLLTIQTPSPGSTLCPGQPVPIRVLAIDSAGKPITTGVMTLVFSNGDPAISLVPTGSDWRGTWTPTRLAPTVKITIVLLQGGVSINSVSAGFSVNLNTAAQTPVIKAITNAAPSSLPSVLAPGTLATVYGTSLAGCTASAAAFPLPTTLCGAQVLMAGTPLPLLYVSDTQINFQVPYGMPVNTSSQLIVSRDAALSVPAGVTMSPAAPGIFAITGASGAVPTAANPVHSGDVLVIYCTGLGEIVVPVAVGSPAAGASPTLNPVSLAIGSVNARVLYAGLTPGFAGLYQVNATVPSGVSPGDQVPVTVSVQGLTSPAHGISVR